MEPSAGRLEGQAHLLPVRVYYEDTDFTGVVYHGAYVRFFERGRSDFLRTVGIGHAQLLDGAEPIAFTVTRLSVDFKRPARIDDALVVRTAIEGAKGPRLAFDQRILRGQALICAAKVEAACIDLAGRPKRPPAVLVGALRPLIARET